MRTQAPAFASVLFALAGTALGGGSPVWNAPVDGLWNNAGLWSPAGVPGASDAPVLPHATAYTVTLNISNSLAGLGITNPLATLSINPGIALSMLGDIDNHGVLVVNPTDGIAFTNLNFAANASLSGTGRVRLGGYFNRGELSTSGGATLTQAAGHTIDGQGRIMAAMINNGTIHANTTPNPLTISGDAKTNNALFHATGGAKMDLISVNINQTPSGLILADGAGSLVRPQANSIITGGTVEGRNGGLFSVSGNSSFDDVTAKGSVAIQPSVVATFSNQLTNLGVLTVNPNDGIAFTNINFNDGAVLTGPGVLRLGGYFNRAELSTTAGATMTHTAGHTIDGQGRIMATMINNGTITANLLSNPMTLSGNAKTNNARMQAVGGAKLDLISVNINQTPTGLILADGAGSLVRPQANSVITGGTVEGRNGGQIAMTGLTSFDSVLAKGSVTVQPGQTLIVTNQLTNQGVLDVNPNDGIAVTTINFNDGAVLTGPGLLRLGGYFNRAELSTTAGATMTHAAGHTIDGQGRIMATMINNGTITANLLSNPMTLSGNAKTNNARMQAVGGAKMDLISVNINQTPTGLILADGAGSLVRPQANSVITGGTVEGRNGGIISMTGNATLSGLNMLGTTHVQPSITLSISGGNTNNGLLAVNPLDGIAVTTLAWTDNSTLGGNGTVRLGGFLNRGSLASNTPSTAASMGPGQRLEGIGRVETPLTLQGTLAPGLSVGTLHATQPVTLTATSTFEAEAGPAATDLLNSSSSFHADGTLTVLLADGFNPPLYWERTIVTATQGVTGTFSAVNAPLSGDARLEIRARYFANEIRIGAYCKADLNADGQTNFFDVSTFLEAFNSQQPEADIAAPFGVLNFFDVSAFLGRYNSGCP
jgi:fibronectin-binding autotransporter adhesin